MPVFQTSRLCNVQIIVYSERQWFRFVEDDEFSRKNLNCSCFKIRVHSTFGAGGNSAFNSDNILISNRMCLSVEFSTYLRIQHNLRFSFTIPEVYEDEAAMVPSFMNPSHKDHFGVYILLRKDTATMSSLEVLKIFWQCETLSGGGLAGEPLNKHRYYIGEGPLVKDYFIVDRGDERGK